MYRIPRGDISLARRFIDKKQEGVYPAMAKESVWTKLRRKVDKEFADELQRQQDIEQQEREQAKALEKQQKKEAAIAAYREKRDLTVADFFRVAGLPLPDDFADIADHTINDFTADPRRLTPDSIFLYWGKSPISAGDPASVLQMAIDSGCLCVISNKPCAHPHTLLLPDTTDALEGTNRIREAYIKASAYIRSLHKAKVITVTGSVGKALKLPDEEILAGIASYHPSGMRQNLLQAGKYRVFADCYNSSLLAVDNTLKVLDELRLPDETKRIAVLGDVLALGDLSEETHREIGRVCARHRIDLLIGYGIAIRYAIEEAAAAGMQAHYYADRAEMEAAVRAAVRPGDIVLFKASHGVNLGASMDKLFGTDLNESSAIGHKQFRIEVHGDFEFYIFENSASLKTYLGHDAVVEVPAFVTATVTDELHETEVTRDLPVEKIGKTAFRGNEEIREVVLPETVVRIRDGAFQGSGLESLDAPDSLLSIGARAFADCPHLTTVNLSEATDQLGDAVTENSPQAMIMYR